MKQTNQKLDILLIIRGLLAISVVIWHFTLYKENSSALVSTPGRTAVWIFFGISGYVISYGFYSKRYLLNTKDLKAFYINRFLRIYPLFFLLSLIAFLTEYFLNGKIAISLSQIPTQLFMLQFNHDYVLNSVFWTLGIEVQYYLIAPLIALFFLYPFKHSLVWYVAGYLLLLSWIPFAHFILGMSFDGRNVVANLTHFFAGMAACKWFVFGKKQFVVKTWLTGGTIVLLLIITNYLYRDSMKLYWTVGHVLIDVIIVLSVLLHSNLNKKTIPQRNLVVRALMFAGVISYGIYAWHSYLNFYLPIPGNSTFMAVAITVFAAFLSYQLIEKPILKLKKVKKKVDEAW